VALVACNDAQSDGRAATRLPSQTDGQAMVRLPAAGTAGAREALSRRPKKKRASPVTPTSRAFGAADVEAPQSAKRSPDDGDELLDDDGAEAIEGAGAQARAPKRDAESREHEGSGANGENDEAGENGENQENRENRENEPRGDVREPPEDTPAAIAKVFRRLPVSVHDGPPVGGIGASGIHIDRIWLGSKRSKDGCGGKDDGFSIGGGDEVNVCFRVVHGRTQEDVDVIWEKDGDLAQRRRGVTILPLHAYRTRSYLVLRNEYVGSWRVRIFSEDHVELATKTFNVVE
jgi:hypothetical protein